MKNKNSVYLIFSIVLVILSVIGGFFLFNTLNQQDISNNQSDTLSKVELIPTDAPQEIDYNDSFLEPTSVILEDSPLTSPTATTTIIPTITLAPTLAQPTNTPAPTTTPTSTSSSTLNFSSSTDNFSVSYSSSRKLYQDITINANRHTFYLAAGNFAIHVNSEGAWSWVHPSRQFTDNYLVDGQPTFKYDIDTQTIVDLQSNGKNYTIQCVHNNNQTLKNECHEFTQSFKLL